MIPWVKRLLWDESAFERYARSLILAAASAWQFYQIEGTLTSQGVIGAIVMGLAGMIGAGEMNNKSGEK